MKNYLLKICCFLLLTANSWASADIPVDQGIAPGIDPPPDNVPIDSLLPFALFIAVVMVGYYFNRRAKALLNNK